MIGFCGRHFHIPNCLELCKLSARAGFSAISLSGAQVRGLDKTLCSRFSIREVCWEPEAGLSITETAQIAEQLGAQVLVLPAQALDADDLRKVLADTRLLLAWENSCAGEELAEMVDAWNRTLGTDRFYACLNTGCAIVSGEKPERSAVRLGSRLISVHVNDNHGKRDSGLLPYRGRSAMDWTAFLRKLGEMPFEGMLWLDVRGPACQSLKIVESWLRGQYAMACYLQQTVEDYRNPARRPGKLRQWLLEELRAGVFGTLTDVTNLHLSELPTAEGFLAETAVTEYKEMRSASAAVYALFMLENQSMPTAKAVLTYILSLVKEKELLQIPVSVGANREVLDEGFSLDAGAKMVLAFARTCLKDEDAVFEEAFYEICRKQMCICIDAAAAWEKKGNLDFGVLSFVGAAAEAMCLLAKRREDRELMYSLENFSETIRPISERLLAEKTDWRVFAPLAAGWNGLNKEKAESAMRCLVEKTSIYDAEADIRIQMSEYDVKSCVKMQQFASVIGWMIEYHRLRKDAESIGEWVRFFKQYQKRDYILAESFCQKDGKWCFGSRYSVETGAWFCMMAYRLRRELEQEGR